MAINKLQVLTVNGQKVIFDKKSYYINELNGNKEVISKPTITPGYEDISSIENWYNFGYLTGKDWKYVRNEIKELVFLIGGSSLETYNNLTSNEKKIASELFLLPKVLRSEFYSDAEDFKNSISFNTNSIECRRNRYNNALSIIFLNLERTEALQIINDLNYRMSNGTILDLRENYIQYGIDTVRTGDTDGLFDYLQSTAGTIFEHTGLKSRNLTPIIGTIDDLIDRMIDVLEFGNYCEGC